MVSDMDRKYIYINFDDEHNTLSVDCYVSQGQAIDGIAGIMEILMEDENGLTEEEIFGYISKSLDEKRNLKSN